MIATTIVAIIVLALALTALLRQAASRLRREEVPLEDAIDRVLPQTQCGQCGYPGCRPYARAIASGAADINQCPPGGAKGISTLAALLGREPKPLNADNGVEKPKAIAVIDETICIGCTKCIQACPVDAILGASKLMHSVIDDECTGCELCIAPCPVDCITMVPLSRAVNDWRYPDAQDNGTTVGGRHAPA